jgi:hypothetical protein
MDHWLQIAVLDGLLGLDDHARIQKLAPAWLIPGTYIEPFALRALGAARGDETLIEQAIARYEGMGLDWHAEQTRKLIPSRSADESHVAGRLAQASERC